MANKQIRLRVLTPDRQVLDEAVDMVILRAAEGDMGVLPGHEPCAAQLSPGLLRATSGREASHVLAVMGGFATVGGDEVTVLTPLAEPPEQMEAALERIRRERAENAAQEKRSDAEIQRVEMALRRALVQMDSGAPAPVRDADASREGEE